MQAINTHKPAELVDVQAPSAELVKTGKQNKISNFNLKLSYFSNKLGLCFSSYHK
jgi:hypothetical protein